MKRINPPQRFKDLKTQRMWSLDFAEQNYPTETFTYHVLLKVGEGSYEHHGFADTASAAFRLRRELVGETGLTKFFIRAKRQLIADFDRRGTTEDSWRDALRTGDDSFIDPSQHEAFNNWAANEIRERSAYKRQTTDRPRFNQ